VRRADFFAVLRLVVERDAFLATRFILASLEKIPQVVRKLLLQPFGSKSPNVLCDSDCNRHSPAVRFAPKVVAFSDVAIVLVRKCLRILTRQEKLYQAIIVDWMRRTFVETVIRPPHENPQLL
jgi:hypothetical protein